MKMTRISVVLTVIALGILPVTAQILPDTTLTIAMTGTLGPILEGSDPLNANGNTGSLTLFVSESLTPIKVSGNTAVYLLPAGAVTGVIGAQSFTSTSPAKMSVTLASPADVVTVSYFSRDQTMTRVIAYLAPGSWDTTVLMHPVPFSPSPQDLHSATVLGGTGSRLAYAQGGGVVTVLGLTGTASASTGANPIVPDPEAPAQ